MELGFILFAVFVIIITVGGFALVIYRIIKFFKNTSLPSIRRKKSIVRGDIPPTLHPVTKPTLHPVTKPPKREPYNKYEDLMNPSKFSLDEEKKMNVLLEKMGEELDKQNESKLPTPTPVKSTGEEQWKIIVGRLSEELDKQNESKLPTPTPVKHPEPIKKFKKNVLSKYSLYHISSLENLESILSEGILSHNLSMEKNPKRISDREIVKYRKGKKIKSGYTLTYYANFYFRPKNIVFYRILKENENTHTKENIIVFEINLDTSSNDIFVSDTNCARNASTIDYLPAHDIFSSIDDMMTKPSCFDDKLSEKEKHMFTAECLIPGKVEVSNIHTIHVQNEYVEDEIKHMIKHDFPHLKNIKVKKNPKMFSSW